MRSPIGYDAGVVSGPWGATHFVEGVGIGLLAHAISQPDFRELFGLARRMIENHGSKPACDGCKSDWKTGPLACTLTLDGTICRASTSCWKS